MIKRINIYQVLILFSILSSFIFAPSLAYAQEVGITVSPASLQLRTPNLTAFSTPITVTNLTDRETTFSFELLPITVDVTGKTSIAPAQDPESAAFQAFADQIQIEEGEEPIEQITLAAKQKKSLVLTITPDEKDKAKDYYFSLLFVSERVNENVPYQEGESKAAASIHASVALPVLLAIQQDITPQATLTAFSTQTLRTDGPVPFTVRLRNDSDTFVTAEGTISIKNMFGQRIGEITLPKTPILRHAERVFFSNELKIDQSDNNYQAIWPEKVIFGGHTARLDMTITQGTKGMKISDRISFYALPIKALGIGLGIILLLCYSIYRFRKLGK